MMRSALIAMLLLVATLSSANASEVGDKIRANPWHGIEMAKIGLHGQSYEFPVGDAERKADIYFLKLALAGDKVALDVFLGGADTKWFYIGKDSALWLKVKRSEPNFEVVVP